MADQPSKLLRSIAPYFIVDDVVRSAEHYRDRLGFCFDRYWGDPPCFVILGRDGMEIMLRSVGQKGFCRPNRRTHAEASWDAYIWVNDVAALYSELVDRKATIVKHPEVAVYGMKEFEVADLDGYVICFGQDIGQ